MVVLNKKSQAGQYMFLDKVGFVLFLVCFGFCIFAFWQNRKLESNEDIRKQKNQ